MLKVDIDETNGVALLEPDGALTEDDFRKATVAIDAYIGRHDGLIGLIIHTKAFPGWRSFGAFVSHLIFVKDHHQQLSCVAVVTDSIIGDFGEKVASHFVRAKIKHFKYNEFNRAKEWVLKSRK